MKKDMKKIGKQNVARGRRFEQKVREDFEKKGWIVSRWCNNVEFDKMMSGKLIPAKQGKFRKTSTGFPDFVGARLLYWNQGPLKGELIKIVDDIGQVYPIYRICGVECKSNGRISKEEKQKLRWLLKNNVFAQIYVAKKSASRGKIEYLKVENEN